MTSSWMRPLGWRSSVANMTGGCRRLDVRGATETPSNTSMTRSPPEGRLCSAYKNFLFQNPLFCPSILRRREGREGLRKVKNHWVGLSARGTDLRYGHHKAAGRQRHLQADLP